MQITVRVRPDVALTLHQRQSNTDASAQLLRTAEELGVTLEPLHPGARDPLLTPYFVVEVPDQGTAERVIAHLQRSAAVEAAYLKPPGESP